jgi:hypothetical protein
MPYLDMTIDKGYMELPNAQCWKRVTLIVTL